MMKYLKACIGLWLLAAVASGQERTPDFSWDHVPLYVHLRKDTAYTDDEIRYLATFPLITFEKANGHKDSGSVEAGTLKAARAVKAINPKTKIRERCSGRTSSCLRIF